MQLKGKKVFITGGTGGMGRPLVISLQKHGAEVIAYDHEIQGDLSKNIESVCQQLKNSTPDILINMAGYNELSFCEHQNAAPLIDLNLLVPIRLTQAVLPGMKKRDTGQIVNIGSMTSLIPLPHFTVYVASKAGLKGFSDALRREVSASGISVTHISPRAVKTEANSGLKAVLNQQSKTHEDDPEVVVSRIIKAIINDETDVRIGWPERLFAWLNGQIPSLIDKGLTKNRLIGESLLSTKI